MKLTDYQWLKSQLEAIERRVTPPASMDFEGAHEVRRCNAKWGGNFQTVALDTTTRENVSDLPIVVAIGINYTQIEQIIPRTASLTVCVEDDVLKCRRHAVVHLKDYEKNRDKWTSLFRSPSNQVSLPSLDRNSFHFVLSNFCLWITNHSWQDIRPIGTRSKLLQNNPLFDGLPNPALDFKHLDALADSLRDKQVVWLAHGFHCEVPALFARWIGRRGITDWLLAPNLGRFQNPATLKYDNNHVRNVQEPIRTSFRG